MHRPTTSRRREKRLVLEVFVLVAGGMVLGLLLPFTGRLIEDDGQTALPPVAFLANTYDWLKALACLAPLTVWLPLTLSDHAWSWVLRQVYVFTLSAGLIGTTLYSAYQITIP